MNTDLTFKNEPVLKCQVKVTLPDGKEAWMWIRKDLIDDLILRTTPTKTIICHSRGPTYKDGGSKTWEVLNKDDCGYTHVRQDNSIRAKRCGCAGLFYGVTKHNQHTELDINNIQFIDKYKYADSLKNK